jgi:phosphatidylserine/phosphatidylglycerophosphate/cardiolipin synthase-like enzyme
MIQPRVATLISELVQNLPENKAMEIAQLLMSGKLNGDLPASSIEDITGMHGSSLNAVLALLRKWEDRPASLAASIFAALEIRREALRNSDRATLVWTGPTEFEVRAQNTMETSKEMIVAAKRRVVILGYVVTKGALPLVKLLAVKQTKGIRIQIILDEARVQLPTIARMWPSKTLPEILESRTRLHAKLTLVDDADILITSANLTYYGLKSNIEIGVRVRGRVALQASELINKLIEERHFTLLNV